MEKETEKELSEAEIQARSIRLGLARGGIAAGLALLLSLIGFGAVGGHWLVAWLAGVCCALGLGLCAYAFTYFKTLERWYKAHPEALPKPEEAEKNAPQGGESGDSH